MRVERPRSFFSLFVGGIGRLLFWLVCLLLFGLSILLSGSLSAEILQIRSVLVIGLIGIGIPLLPALISNAAITWFRHLWNPQAAFGQTWVGLWLTFQVGFLLSLILFLSGPTSRALRQHGHWPFDKPVADFFQLQPSHPVLKKGRELVDQMAYLLDVESPSHPATALARKAPPSEGASPSATSASPRPTTPSVSSNPPLAAPSQGAPLSDAPASPQTPEPPPPIAPRLPPSPTPPTPSEPSTPPPPRLPDPSSEPSRSPFAPPPPPLRPLPDDPSQPLTPLPGVPEKTTIPFQNHGSSAVVNTKLRGQTYPFLLDTGASFLTLTKDVAHRYGQMSRRHGPSMILQTANGKIRARVGLLPSLDFGGYTLRNVAFVVCDTCGDPQRGLVGLLGLNILQRFLFTLDHQKSVIHLQPQSGPPNHAPDMRPFLRFLNLRGSTSDQLFRRVFSLSGTVFNQATVAMKGLRIRIHYLEEHKTIAIKELSLAPLEPGQKRDFSFEDTKAPTFKNYRLELFVGLWSSP